MDTLKRYREIIREVLSGHMFSDYAFGDIQKEMVIDEQNDRYLVMMIGWDWPRRVHGALLHVDIIDGKIWIHRDGTEDGIAGELEEHGVPKSDIVLGFRPPDVRQHTGYAAA